MKGGEMIMMIMISFFLYLQASSHLSTVGMLNGPHLSKISLLMLNSLP